MKRNCPLPLGDPTSSTNIPLESTPLGFMGENAPINATQRESSGQMDDVDLSFLSELLSQEPNAAVPVTNSTPSPSLSSHSMSSGDSVKRTDSPEERKRRLASLPESAGDDALTDDRDERRRMLSAKNARHYRSRKKNELVTLREQVQHFEEQLKGLRLNHNVLRADSAVACWEEKAIAQRLKRRQAEEVNEQLQQALFAHTGYVRNLRSIFTESAPPSTALNMRHYLHTYTHLRKDPQLRARDLETIGTAAKVDRAMQVVLRETSTIPVSTSPEILFQELDLGADGLGKTSTAVYAFNTRDASKAFEVASKAILTTCGVWPDHSRIEASMKFVDVPPTEFNVLYSITAHRYQHNATKAQACTEARDLYYSRMVGSCGVLIWDFVDADDLHPVKYGTFIKRNTVGALVLRPEVCSDGVERMVCRSICTDMQILNNSPKPSLNVAEFALLEDMMVYESIKEGATDWQDTAVAV
ncbi:Transportin-3 [Phytophthora pseudosyringae]|uniref:Transportin-3 n=1 Tax=Phytophthora pseudosyringae TaxID=221518 RepID=A0A8T1W981_9STRA|nr:Transportin-3 [Phytophthora pseudosyringae]